MQIDLGVRVWGRPAALAAAVLGAALAVRPTLDGHEVLVAQTAREMLNSGDWIHPTFAGEPRLQKPPLAYWLTASAYAICGGANEITARLPAFIATLLGVVLLSLYAERAFGRGVGRTAGLVYATTYWPLGFGRSALVDGSLATLVLAAIALAAWDRPATPSTSLPSQRRILATMLGFWGLAGLIVLAKGPVGLTILLPSVFIYRLARGRKPSDVPLVFHWAFAPGVFLFTVLSLGWPLLIAYTQPAAAEMWKGQSVGRFLEHWGPQTRPWYYYIYTIGWLAAPWTPLCLVGLATAVADAFHSRGDERSRHRMLLLLWFTVTLAVMSASAGKRAHYILPGLPPLAVLAALALRDLPSTAFGRELGRRLGGLAEAMRLGRFANAGVGWTTLAFGHAIFATCVLAPLQTRSASIALLSRNHDRLANAAEVLQYGCNDHWTAFFVDHSMQWPRSVAEAANARDVRPILVLASENRVGELLNALGGRVLDRTTGRRSSLEKDPSQALVLVELAADTRTPVR